MAIDQSVVQRSRLGRLLIERKLITSDQLEEAVRVQQATGKRLGEILVEQGRITQRHIDRALRKQKNIRMVAALIALLISPFQLARASDLASSSPDVYTAIQHELINTFESQSALAGGSDGPDVSDVANVQQVGETNLAIILQSGSHDLATIVQVDGAHNTAFISQHGNSQVATITQSGNGNTALIAQR